VIKILLTGTGRISKGTPKQQAVVPETPALLARIYQ